MYNYICIDCRPEAQIETLLQQSDWLFSMGQALDNIFLFFSFRLRICSFFVYCYIVNSIICYLILLALPHGPGARE